MGTFTFSRKLEDIHMNIEARLNELIGSVAGRLHIAHSGNDQVTVDFCLWIREEMQKMVQALKGLIKQLLIRAKQHVDTFMPGFTHLQTAQPVMFGHYMMAYVEMFSQDLSRMRDAIKRMSESPLGATALAGISFPIERFMTAEASGFREPTRNSIDSVSDRYFALEFLSVGTLCAMHLSCLAEKIVLWSSVQFHFIHLSDAFSTGSSIMPQKRNPDAAELIRAKADRLNAALIGRLTVMKGLHLAYSKDMQEDKEYVFDGVLSLELSLVAITGIIDDFKVNKEATKQAAHFSYATATDLSDWLVRELELPFRETHHITRCIVGLAEKKQCNLNELSLVEPQTIHPNINAVIFDILTIKKSVKSRKNFGGTAPSKVLRQIAYRKKHLIAA
ncbi:argininosuccinate lyase [Bartonella sp. AR 15-3]|nr:argininosuccinate lyase [Bartonella sp. AR 15-3]